MTFSRLHTHTLYRTSYGPRVRFLQYCTSLICSASDFQFCNLLKKKKKESSSKMVSVTRLRYNLMTSSSSLYLSLSLSVSEERVHPHHEREIQLGWRLHR